MWQINQPNPLGAYIEARQAGQQYQAGQQQMQQDREQFKVNQEIGRQRIDANRQALDQGNLEQQRALLDDMGRAAAWVMENPQEAEQRLEVVRSTYRPIFGDQVNAVTLEQLPMLQAQIQQELQGGMPANVRGFNAMTEGLTEEDREEARRIELGLAPRASSAAIQYREVTGPDGVTRLVALDPRTERVTAPQTQGVAPEQLASRPEEESAGLIAGAQAQARTDVERDAEMERLRPKARLTMQRAEGRANRVNELVQDIMPRVNVWTAGAVGRPLSGINGTPAADLRAQIGTLQAIAGFDELGQLRAESPTGGALGQVSERELQFLQSVIANIENSQSPEQLRRNLERFNREVQASWQRVQDAYEMDFGGGEQQSDGWSIEVID